MKKLILIIGIVLIYLTSCSDSKLKQQIMIQDLTGLYQLNPGKIWLTHEHVLVDFIGADSISPEIWEHDKILNEIIPYFEELKKHNVEYFVDATPAFLGRDILLLQKIADITGVKIVTNTGIYGARNNKYIPEYVNQLSAESLSDLWVNEFMHGIEGTTIKPGFIKIGVDDNTDTLCNIHKKIVNAAALTHLKTGLTIASHTGKSIALWPQIKILEEMGVSPEAFIWVHAQAENDNNHLKKAAEMGCWISLDGLGWELEEHVAKILFAKENGFLDRILISHDAGWFDPQKEIQNIIPYTDIFTKLYPKLKSQGFTDDEFNLLISSNPARAFSIGVKEAGKIKSNPKAILTIALKI